ncbi:MAG: right-handed parallel beta-helix repeat-containing protein, partial [Candidatus Hydrogenedentes bacterium]|nr:right-handed parallel beta-helix repeat-containing protein [Candidatus Hydrogenedentota bacterium]
MALVGKWRRGPAIISGDQRYEVPLVPHLLTCALMLFLPSLSHGRVLLVPSEFPTIQAAIDAAQAGDTVTVAAGTYEGPFTFKDGIVLQGVDRDEVIFRRNAEGPVLTVSNCSSGTIREITFEHAGGEDLKPVQRLHLPLVRVERSSVEITRCIFRKCAGDAVQILGKGESLIEDCDATDNFWDGFYVDGADAAPTFRNNRSENNGDDGIQFTSGAKGVAENNVFSNNRGEGV